MTLKTENLASVKSILWLVRFGVDASHCVESSGLLHRRKRDAVDEFDRLCLGHPWKCKELLRLEFPKAPMAPASDVRVIRRGVV